MCVSAVVVMCVTDFWYYWKDKQTLKSVENSSLQLSVPKVNKKPKKNSKQPYYSKDRRTFLNWEGNYAYNNNYCYWRNQIIVEQQLLVKVTTRTHYAEMKENNPMWYIYKEVVFFQKEDKICNCVSRLKKKKSSKSKY